MAPRSAHAGPGQMAPRSRLYRVDGQGARGHRDQVSRISRRRAGGSRISRSGPALHSVDGRWGSRVHRVDQGRRARRWGTGLSHMNMKSENVTGPVPERLALGPRAKVYQKRWEVHLGLSACTGTPESPSKSGMGKYFFVFFAKGHLTCLNRVTEATEGFLTGGWWKWCVSVGGTTKHMHCQKVYQLGKPSGSSKLMEVHTGCMSFFTLQVITANST